MSMYTPSTPGGFQEREDLPIAESKNGNKKLLARNFTASIHVWANMLGRPIHTLQRELKIAPGEFGRVSAYALYQKQGKQFLKFLWANGYAYHPRLGERAAVETIGPKRDEVIESVRILMGYRPSAAEPKRKSVHSTSKKMSGRTPDEPSSNAPEAPKNEEQEMGMQTGDIAYSRIMLVRDQQVSLQQIANHTKIPADDVVTIFRAALLKCGMTNDSLNMNTSYAIDNPIVKFAFPDLVFRNMYAQKGAASEPVSTPIIDSAVTQNVEINNIPTEKIQPAQDLTLNKPKRLTKPKHVESSVKRRSPRKKGDVEEKIKVKKTPMFASVEKWQEILGYADEDEEWIDIQKLCLVVPRSIKSKLLGYRREFIVEILGVERFNERTQPQGYKKYSNPQEGVCLEEENPKLVGFNEQKFIPTDAMPGTDQKIEVLRQRVIDGVPLWHPEDQDDYSGQIGGIRPQRRR